MANGQGWTARASAEAQKHAGQLIKYGYHLKDPNTSQRAEALMRALRTYGPRNMDMKLGFLEGVNVNNPVLHRRAKMDAQYVRWLSGKKVPLPPGYPKVTKLLGRGPMPRDGYKVIFYREPGTRTIDARVFTKDGHLLWTKPFSSPRQAAAFKKRIEEI